MTSTDTWTYLALLEWTTKFLRDHGVETPRLDAEVLLAEAAGCQRIELYTRFDVPATEECRVAFRELVRRRGEGTPVAYLVGHREFYSLSFRVTPDTLIPRPETEHLVVEALDRIKEIAAREPDRTLRIADVGTGSGIIAVAIAKHAKNVAITATDLSEPALEIAKKNAVTHKVDEIVSFVHGDLLLPIDGDPLDLIVSNPPYISQDEMRDLDPDVKNHEPHLALVGGPNGTEVIQRLVPQSLEKLREGGWLLIEISPMIEERVREIIESKGGFELSPTIKDLAGHARVIAAKKMG